jgi:hypothetical protein
MSAAALRALPSTRLPPPPFLVHPPLHLQIRARGDVLAAQGGPSLDLPALTCGLQGWGPDVGGRERLFTVYNRIKLQVDLQADKSPVVVKGPFFPRVVNLRYQIRGTMRDARVDLVKPRNLDLQEVKPMHLILKNIKTNLIY